MRFAQSGLVGLRNAPRPGAAPRYDAGTKRRILAKLDDAPPSRYATWTGSLVADALSDVSEHQVWRVPAAESIHLQRQRSWCISTDPQFAAKAADVVGLYLDPPESAVILSVDVKPHIQALERAQGYLKLPNGKAVTGFSHEYKRHGTTTLFAALEVLTGMVVGGHAHRRRRRDFLAFMNEVASAHPAQELHVILDNPNTHKPKHDRWLARRKNVHFHFTPTHANWLNQIECWAGAHGHLRLRKTRRNIAPRVLGLLVPAHPTTSADDHRRVGTPPRSGPASLASRCRQAAMGISCPPVIAWARRLCWAALRELLDRSDCAVSGGGYLRIGVRLANTQARQGGRRLAAER